VSRNWLAVQPDLVTALLTRCTFPPVGSPVTCAVSGGADSTALLALAVAAGCRPTAVHVDHGLRPGSSSEADVVAETASRLGVPFVARRVSVPPGPNLEARARTARAEVLPPGVLTGHTADDQAETVLINLLRGAATSGLSAMRPGSRRPLLALRRTETVAVCRSLDLSTVHDPSNDDVGFLRNRIRHELLPLLADASRRDLVPVLTRQADLCRDDDDLLEELSRSLDPCDAVALAAAPKPLARRAVRRWLVAEDPEHHPPDAAAVQRVLDVAAGRAVACEVAGGRRVRRHRQRLSLEPVRDARTGTIGVDRG
jgi:tRNA(Ile)-lysidine synthase